MHGESSVDDSYSKNGIALMALDEWASITNSDGEDSDQEALQSKSSTAKFGLP